MTEEDDDDLSYVEENFRAYVDLLNGIPNKEFGELEEIVFDDLFHDDLSVINKLLDDEGKNTRNTVMADKSELRKIVKGLFQQGIKATVEDFQRLDHGDNSGSSSVRYQIHYATTDGLVSLHQTSVATIKNDKILTITPEDPEDHTKLVNLSSVDSMMSIFEARFRNYFALFDGTSVEFDAEKTHRYHELWHDDFQMDSAGLQHTKESWLQVARGLAKRGVKIDILMFRVVDESHAKYTVEISTPDGPKKVTSISTVKGGKLYRTEPVDGEGYLSLESQGHTAADMVKFESSFKAYWELFDGTSWQFGPQQRRCFNNLYHDDFQSTVPSLETKSKCLKNAKSMATAGVKAKSYWIKFLDDFRVEYLLNITPEDGAAKQVHMIGTLKNGKLNSTRICHNPSKGMDGKTISLRASSTIEENGNQNNRASSRSNNSVTKKRHGSGTGTAVVSRVPSSNIPINDRSLRESRKASRPSNNGTSSNIKDNNDEGNETSLQKRIPVTVANPTPGAFRVSEVCDDDDDHHLDGETLQSLRERRKANRHSSSGENDDADRDGNLENAVVVEAEAAPDYEEEMQAAVQRALEQGRQEGRQQAQTNIIDSNVVIAVAHPAEETDKTDYNPEVNHKEESGSSTGLKKRFNKLFTKKKK